MFSICIIIGKIILGFTIVSSIVVERWTAYQEKRQAKNNPKSPTRKGKTIHE